MEPLTLEEKTHAILSLESPRWGLVHEQYQRMRGDHNLSEAQIAADLGYRTQHAFRQSSAYRRVVTGIVRLWLRTQ